MTAIDLAMTLVGMLGFLLAGLAVGMIVQKALDQAAALAAKEAELAAREAELREKEQLYDQRRVPYSVVEQVENLQTSGVRRLQALDEALEQHQIRGRLIQTAIDEARIEVEHEIQMLGRVLGRQPLEGDGRNRHRVPPK